MFNIKGTREYILKVQHGDNWPNHVVKFLRERLSDACTLIENQRKEIRDLKKELKVMRNRYGWS